MVNLEETKYHVDFGEYYVRMTDKQKLYNCFISERERQWQTARRTCFLSAAIPTLLTSQLLYVGTRIFSAAQLYIKARMAGFS